MTVGAIARRHHNVGEAMRRRPFVLVCAVVTISALALAGGSSAFAGAASAPGVSAKQVVVGLVNPSSGAFGSQFAAFVDGAKARVYIANKDGGINGRKIKLIVKDDAGDPTRSKNEYLGFANDGKVFGIIAGSFWVDVAAQQLADKGIPVVGWGFTPSYKKYPNFFGHSAAAATTDETQGADTIAKWAKSKGATKMATLAFSDPYGPPAQRVQTKIFEKLGGKNVVTVLDLPLQNADYTAVIQRIKDSGADYINAGFNQSNVVAFGKALAQANIHPKVTLLGQGYQEDILKALGSAGEGISFALEFAPFELKLPPHARYLAGLKKVAPGETRGIQSMIGWMSLDAFLKGLEVAGKNPTWESFITNLRNVHDYDAGGLEPAFDYTQVPKVGQKCWYFVTIHKGKFVPDGKTPKCGKIITGL
ncbi:MAG: hypothetical protein E6G60_16330 [Actinobacteria bacterium]|nr:MAG: hypothetical protein E6G60_16330 [Actinomycetota bacterium]